MEFTKEDHEAISAAIRSAEQRTSGQIVCVLVRSSSDYVHIPLLWASVLALCLPWPLIYLTQWSVQRIFLLQIVLFLVVAVLAFLSVPLRLALVPRPVQRARAHRAALEQFLVRGMTRTNRTGVLIFVSLAEHYARIIADEGIARKVHHSEWQDAIDALIACMRDDRITAGFIAAIERCGDVLATHAPADGSSNELPDRLYVM